MDIIDIHNYLKKNLSESRYNHSVSTAETAYKLCIEYGEDPDKGYLAGLVHDIAREYSNEDVLRIAEKDGLEITDTEKNDPVILHGRAGAVVAREIFAIDDPSIIEAMQVHTTGKSGMCLLSKILFVADYIEPKRKHITKEYVENLKGKSLNSITLIVLRSIHEYLNRKHIIISGNCIKLSEELKSEDED